MLLEKEARIIIIDKDSSCTLSLPVDFSSARIVSIADFSNGRQYLFVAGIDGYIAAIDLRDVKNAATEIEQPKILISNDRSCKLVSAYFHNDRAYFLSEQGSVYVVDKDLQICQYENC